MRSKPALHVGIPLFNLAPKLYRWFLDDHMRRLYRRLRIVEEAAQTELTALQVVPLQTELEDIDRSDDCGLIRKCIFPYQFQGPDSLMRSHSLIDANWMKARHQMRTCGLPAHHWLAIRKCPPCRKDIGCGLRGVTDLATTTVGEPTA